MSSKTSSKILEKNWVVGPFQCNCRLIACDQTGEAALVDPGDEAARLMEALRDLKTPSGAQVRVRYLLHTHGHLDHVGATRDLREALQSQSQSQNQDQDHKSTDVDALAPKILLHSGDEPLYLQLRQQGQLFGIRYRDPLPLDGYLEHDQEFRVGALRVSVIHTPGHSPGSVCLRLHEDSDAGSRETIFSGDTLFQGSVGRTDLWGGDQDLMFRSIRERILRLDGDTRVCPGHGPETTVGLEKRSNPFLI
ncbi:MAG: hypothetical protein RJB38_2335 [Pseudomonadota bacterium]|jgi:glyoxylase-like metal-dependent hydrolase (beta-lactamase superfamily II)